MKRLTVLLIYFVLVLSVLCCISGPATCVGTVVHKEIQEPVWGVGIGQTGVGTIGAVPVLTPEQYLITVAISNRDEVFSVEQGIYRNIIIGDTIVCNCFDSTFTCDFGEN